MWWRGVVVVGVGVCVLDAYPCDLRVPSGSPTGVSYVRFVALVCSGKHPYLASSRSQSQRLVLVGFEESLEYSSAPVWYAVGLCGAVSSSGDVRLLSRNGHPTTLGCVLCGGASIPAKLRPVTCYTVFCTTYCTPRTLAPLSCGVASCSSWCPC